MHKIICLCLCLLFSMGSLPAQDWKNWSEGDAKKIIKKATKRGKKSFFKDLANSLGGITVATLGNTRTSVPFELKSIWLTDDVCWAIARIAQIKERRTDEETVNKHDACRDAEHYALYVSASSMLVGGRNNRIEPHPINTENLGRIFLQHKKNADVFLRPSKVVEPSGRVSNDEGVIVLFPRDKEFIAGQREIQLELMQENIKVKVTFKLKDLIEPGKFEDL